MATTELSREGSKKVKQVCQDFMTREDEALAQRLQDEEFQTHYIRNRQERGTARVDVKAAKNAYLEEVKQAGLLREYEYQKLAADDAWLASELQHRLDEEENLESQQRNASEMQDEEYAMLLQQREKEKMKRERQRRLRNRIERERKELERIEREKEMAPEETPGNKQYGFPHSVPRREQPAAAAEGDAGSSRVAPRKDHEKWDDLRSYEVEDDAEKRHRQQELEDEELARRLQQREQEKLRKLMEERDRRLALKMQKQETQEYRRERAERQARKTSSLKEHAAEAGLANDQEVQRGRKEANPKDDPDQNYYEKPVYNVDVIRPESDRDRQDPVHRGDNGSDARGEPERAAPKSRNDPIYESIEPEIPSYEEPPKSQKISQGNYSENRKLPEKLESERTQGTPSQNRSFRSKEGASQGARPTRDEKMNDEAGRQHFANVAACIDPTFDGAVKEEASEPDDRVWAIGNSGIRVSSSSRPAPLIQNTRRKQSKDKSAKDKEKCKQQ